MTSESPPMSGARPENRHPGCLPGNVIVSPAGGFAWPEDSVGGAGFAAPGALSKKDQDVLNELLALNQNAALVFQRAACAAQRKKAQTPLCELEKLHRTLAANISQHLQDAGNSASGETSPVAVGGENAEPQGKRYFNALGDELMGDLDAEVIGQLVAAEDKCLARMEMAPDEGVSMATQTFLAKQMEELGWAYKHIKALQATIETETRQ